MIKTRSDALLVFNINTAAAGGSAVTVTNSSSILITNTSLTVMVQNSSGWNIGVGSTSIVNSAGWVVSVANTIGLVIASGSMNIINSSGWVLSASSTIMNSSRLVTTYDCAYAMDGTALVTLQYGTINITNSTNTIIVRAQSDTRIKVMSLMLVSQGTGLLTWQSGSSSGVGLTGPVYLAANVGYVLPFNPNGWFQTGVETLLNANLTTSTSIGGCITYFMTS